MNIQSILNLLRHKKGVYNKAGNYYNKMNLYFVVPSILITTLSSIFAFLSTSDIIFKPIMGEAIGFGYEWVWYLLIFFFGYLFKVIKK